jgi:hypothetical protein
MFSFPFFLPLITVYSSPDLIISRTFAHGIQHTLMIRLLHYLLSLEPLQSFSPINYTLAHVFILLRQTRLDCRNVPYPHVINTLSDPVTKLAAQRLVRIVCQVVGVRYDRLRE